MREEDRPSKMDMEQFVKLHQVRIKFNNLAKNFLYMLEDVKDEYQIPEEKFFRIRKRILDIMNDSLRELDSSLDKK